MASKCLKSLRTLKSTPSIVRWLSIASSPSPSTPIHSPTNSPTTSSNFHPHFDQLKKLEMIKEYYHQYLNVSINDSEVSAAEEDFDVEELREFGREFVNNGEITPEEILFVLNLYSVSNVQVVEVEEELAPYSKVIVSSAFNDQHAFNLVNQIQLYFKDKYTVSLSFCNKFILLIIMIVWFTDFRSLQVRSRFKMAGIVLTSTTLFSTFSTDNSTNPQIPSVFTLPFQTKKPLFRISALFLPLNISRLFLGFNFLIFYL